MEKISVRSVNPETRKYIKKQVVELHKAKKNHTEIAKTFNISYDAVSRIIRSYNKNGTILKEKTRGRKKGEKRTLTVKQEREIQRIIIDKHPEQVKLGFALWTRAAVQQLIRNQYNIDMPIRSVSNYLNRWGLTCSDRPKELIAKMM